MSTQSARPPFAIGYTQYRTNLPGGRFANVETMRACLVQGDGSGSRVLAEELTRRPGAWAQFAGWSPDGRQAVISSAWESAENAAWEEAHQTFRLTEGWLIDICLLDLADGQITNLTAVERVSGYNSGLFFWPGDPARLGFQAVINGESRPFSMSLDGHHKQDLSSGASGFTYGVSASPDGRQIAYHKSYRVHIADFDGSHAQPIETGQPFNFMPQWSPDGAWLLFLAGEHYDCHPYVVRRDGTGLHKLAGRGGYRGVVDFLDVPDFHGGSSDTPVWSPDGQWVYYTAQVGPSVELCRISLQGQAEQLTHSGGTVLHYHPRPSPDGEWLLFGSNRTGTRQLYVARADGAGAYPVTAVPPNWGAMWGHWQPAAGL